MLGLKGFIGNIIVFIPRHDLRTRSSSRTVKTDKFRDMEQGKLESPLWIKHKKEEKEIWWICPILKEGWLQL